MGRQQRECQMQDLDLVHAVKQQRPLSLSFQPVIQKTRISLSAILIIPSPSKPVFQHFSLPGGTGLWYTHWPCAFSLDSLQSFHSSIRSKWREGGGFRWRILPVRLGRGRGISFFRSSCQSWPSNYWFFFLLSGGEVLLKEIESFPGLAPCSLFKVVSAGARSCCRCSNPPFV